MCRHAHKQPVPQPAQRRLQAVALHVAPTKSVASSDPSEQLLVGFEGANFNPLLPPSLDASGGCGRLAWPDLKQGGLSKDSAVAHQAFRREAETGGSSLWRIHGKMYDLSKFVNKHPGGPVFIELTRGTDATQAFEAHHLDFALAEEMLTPYYVRDVQSGEFAHGDRFTFEEGGFFRTLRRRLLERLRAKGGPREKATAATASMRAACTVALAQFAALHTLARTGGSLVAAALAGVGLIGCWGVGHNFMHQAQSKAGLWPYAMDLTGMGNAADWRITHCLSHHLDTNLETDIEHQLLPQYEDVNSANWPKYALPLVFPFVSLSGIQLLASSLKYTVTTAKQVLSGDGSTERHWGHVVPGVFPFLQLVSYVHGRRSFRKGVLLYMVQSAAFLLGFMPLAAGVHHSAPAPDSEESEELQRGPSPRNTWAWMEGQAGAQSDWGAHQVSTTTDHSVFPRSMPAFLRDWLSLTCFAYLNNHKLHHLFPGVDASHLHEFHEVLEETAKEFGLDPREVKVQPVGSVYRGFFRYVFRKEVRSKL